MVLRNLITHLYGVCLVFFIHHELSATEKWMGTPTMANDIHIDVVQGNSIFILTLEKNEYNQDDNISMYLLEGGSASGKIQMIGDKGVITYEPIASEIGHTVTINYQICDAHVQPSLCSSATISINILADSDGDSIPNNVDIDDDNDGILDVLETNYDFDHDGIPNHLDLDSDNDGITDIFEAGGVDINKDGMVDFREEGQVITMIDNDQDGLTDDPVVDLNGDGVADQIIDVNINGGELLLPINSDNDTLPDYIDIDSDNDGIVDFLEAQSSDNLILPNEHIGSNGWIDNFEAIGWYPDSDLDAIPDYMDKDSDGDGKSDLVEAYDFSGDGKTDMAPKGEDSDGDGLDNAFDVDKDNPINKGGASNGHQSYSFLPDINNEGNEKDWREIDTYGIAVAILPDRSISVMQSEFKTKFVFSQNIMEFNHSHVIVENGKIVEFESISDSIYQAIIAPENNKSILVKIPENSVQNKDGKGNYPSMLVEVAVDNNSPSPSFIDIPEAVKNINPFSITIHFDEVVKSFTQDDLFISGGYANNLNTIDAQNFTYEIHPNGNGNIEIGIKELVAYDLAGIPNSTAVNRTIIFDSDPPNPPIVNATTSFSGKPVITGVWDELDATKLTVTINDLQFILGESPELLADGLGHWVLELANISKPIPFGVYDVVVENSDLAGNSVVDLTQNELTIIDLSTRDTDKDGIVDQLEYGSDIFTPLDSDEDGVFNYMDIDSDNDGIADRFESGGIFSFLIDSDQDGVPDYIDLDSDNDGILDAIETGFRDIHISGKLNGDITVNGNIKNKLLYEAKNLDGDSFANHIDIDSDNDGISDQLENGSLPSEFHNLLTVNKYGVILNLLSFVPADNDEDDIPNFLDSDSDDDGLSDVLESGGEDYNLDGKIDGIENDHGIIQNRISTNHPDSDGDGLWDYIDSDSDNDGLADIVETMGLDINNDGKVDKILNNHLIQESQSFYTDSDNDNLPDHLDEDSDNDHIPDFIECFEFKSDSINHLRRNDKIDKRGIIGGRLNNKPCDADFDEIPNFQDDDDDGDGILTVKEDHNKDGIYTNDDCDNDNIPDFLDVDICYLSFPITPKLGFSPNGDGNNDTWFIPEINNYPKNKVQIFNRWGRLIYEVEGYDNNQIAWNGYAIKQSGIHGNEVPDGTYFYVIHLEKFEKPGSGFIIVKR